MPVSQNGFSANEVSETTVWLIPGTTRSVRLRADNCGFLLTHFASWFDAHIESIDEGQLDDWGYAPRMVRGSATELSNHASGTALDINATKHPLGVRGTFTPVRETMIRKQLKVYRGALRWGGDYVGRPDEMHVEINANIATVNIVTAILKSKRAVARALGFVDLSNVREQARTGGATALPGVKRIQRALNERVNAGLTVDGHFGPATKTAYVQWQRALGYHGKAADGVPGPATLKILGTKRFRVAK